MTELATLTKEVLGAFFLGGLLLGAISQRTHFCTMGAISDVVHLGDWTRVRQWVCAMGVAMLGFASLSDLGLIDSSKTLYASTRLMWLSSLVGGVMFGYGMVIASGCGNKALVRMGGGQPEILGGVCGHRHQRLCHPEGHHCRVACQHGRHLVCGHACWR